MKKLSEIGRSVHLLPLTPVKGDEIIMTPAERRKLVREAVYQFIMDHTESYEASDALGECMKKFYEEQGL